MFTIKQPIINTSIVYTNSTGESVSFFIEPIINRRLREKLKPDNIYTILNEYIKYKGKKFQDELYIVLVRSKDIINAHSTIDEVTPVPYPLVHGILDMFDFQDVKEFILKTGIIKAPSTLPNEYDITIELDGKGSREQTYLKNDYIELIALITILKATTPALGNYAYIKDNILSKTIYKEYILFNFYNSHPIFEENPAFVKIFESLIKLVDRLLRDEEGTAIRIIDKTISRDILPLYVTGLVVIQKLLLNDELDDNTLRNTVTKIHIFASDQLKPKDTSNRIKIKYFANEDTDTNESDSVFENGRVSSDINMGYIKEAMLQAKDPVKLARDIGIKSSDSFIKRVVNVFKIFIDDDVLVPLEESIYITSWIFKDILDPRFFDYLEGETFVFMAVGFIWLYENEFDELALIISSVNRKDEVGSMTINITQRLKIDQEHKDTLSGIFRHNKPSVVNGVPKDVSYVEESINIISKAINSYNLYTIMPESFMEKMFGTINKDVTIPETIKNDLAKLIITVNSSSKL